MDKFYIKDDKFYVENEVELIELTLDELIDATNVLARKEAMMEVAVEIAVHIANQKSAHLWTVEEIKNKAQERLKNESL